MYVKETCMRSLADAKYNYHCKPKVSYTASKVSNNNMMLLILATYVCSNIIWISGEL